MQTVTPFLWFNNNGEEAMTFYTTLFPDSKIIDSHKNGDTFMMGTFQIFGREFFVLDGGPLYKFNESFSMFVSCDTQEEVDIYWEALTANGGEESRCGWLKDRFGLSWQIIPKKLGQLMGDPDREKAGRAMQAMMSMHKIDSAALQKAFDGN